MTTSTPTALTRREFLAYVWGASMALFMGETTGALVWFAVPRFAPGEFGGLFTLSLPQLPSPGADPLSMDEGRFWLVNVTPEDAADPRHPEGHAPQPGLLALYKVCVHLGCLYKWIPNYGRFECPCHGSTYLKDGVRVVKPAARNLDRFVLRALNAQGLVLAETRTGNPEDPAVGQPLALPPGTIAVQVDTGQRIPGRRNNGPSTLTET
jgi:cytochrome b6-f complex iron-sulfur subunit